MYRRTIRASSFLAKASISTYEAPLLQTSASNPQPLPQHVLHHHNHSSYPRLIPHRHQRKLRRPRPRPPYSTINKTNVDFTKSFDYTSTIKPRDIIPAFTLSNALDEPVGSMYLLCQGPLLINLYRGEWCPDVSIDPFFFVGTPVCFC